jgi:hypothetical protein
MVGRKRSGSLDKNWEILLCRGGREIRAVGIAYMATRCDGRTDPRIGLDSCSDHGNSRSLFDCTMFTEIGICTKSEASGNKIWRDDGILCRDSRVGTK